MRRKTPDKQANPVEKSTTSISGAEERKTRSRGEFFKYF